ncbi:lipopolysaccharide biosynthesis protein [Rhizobium sp. L1K21]|uniref:lipopolysaccharide biosynthesis protein n=1 Tax=Rhizobium sp. L1K21 TaxID=2954933 RepID=UPI0020935C60|nr:oligosaccharide flippase family protein [Rhizobium sp. L1K21]MCO6185301.1 oligosaccharide flippase family protein [Rhizobium sp. L1K21]
MNAEPRKTNARVPIMRNSALNAAAGMAMLLTGFASSVVIARLLGPEANGAIAFAVWLATTGGLVAELGTGVSLLRLLPQLHASGYDAEARRGFGSWLARAVTFTTLMIALGYGLFIWAADDAHWLASAPQITIITAFLFIVQSIGSFSKNFLIGEQRLGTFFKISVVSAVLQLLVVALGAYFYGITGAILGYLVGQLGLFGHTLKLLSNKPQNCGVELRGLINSSSIVIAEFIVTAIFLNRPEILFLQQLTDVETVGYYAIAISLANLALQLPIQLSGSLMPYFASHRTANGGEIPRGVFTTVVRNFALLAMPMSFGLAAVAQPLVVGIYGEPFATSGVIVAILALGAPANVFLQLCTLYVFALDRPAIRLKVAIGGSVLLAGGSLLTIPYFGGEGAAISRNIVFVLMCIYMVMNMRLAEGVSAMLLPVLRITAAASMTGMTAYLVAHTLGGLGGVVLAIVAGMLVYIPGLRVFGATTAEDGQLLGPVANRAPRRLRPFVEAVLRYAIPKSAGPGSVKGA